MARDKSINNVMDAYSLMNTMLFPLLLVFYEMVTYLANDMYLPALPAIATEFMASNAHAQLTLTAWFLGSVSMQLILGPVSDRYGRRPVLLVGGLIFILSTVACAVAPDLITMCIARFIQGSTVCSVLVAGYASIHELYDQARSIRILALMGSVTILAPAFGPLAGGLLLMIVDWRFTFWLLALWAIGVLVLLWRCMPESNPHPKPFELKALFKSYGAILASGAYQAHTLVFCLLFGGMILWIAAGPFLVIDTLHHTPVMFGLLQAAIFGSFIVGAQAVKYLMTRYAVGRVITIGLTMVAVASISMVIVGVIWGEQALGGFVAAMMVAAAGCALVAAPLQRLAIEAAAQPMGVTMAVFSTMMAGFGVLASLAVNLIYDGSLGSLIAMIAVTFILACAIRVFYVSR